MERTEGDEEMSRLEETIVSINAVRDAIRKESKSASPILFTVPILSQIAVSLAVIADVMSEEEENEQTN